MRNRLPSILAVFVFCFLAASCDDDNPTSPGSSPSPTPSASPGVVTIQIVNDAGNMSFNPAVANVRAGQLVQFVNSDNETHEMASDTAGVFDVGIIAAGATSATFSISTVGVVPYHCEIHPTMVGSINVMP